MSFVSIKSKFHIAIDGQGLILQGAPDRLAYEMKQAPIYGNRFAQGDRSYGDFSFWWFWTQTDWSAGLKEDPNWADDAKFVSSKNLDAFSVGGQLKILDKPVVQTTDLSVNSDALTRCVYGTVDDGTNTISRFFLGNDATTVDGSNGAKLWQSSDGDTWTLINEFVNISSVIDLFISLQTLYILLNSDLYVFNDATTPFTTVTERKTEFNVSGLSCSYFHSGCDVNGVAHIVGATLDQASLKTSTDDGATFTQRILFPVGVFVYNCISFNGEFYYFREYENRNSILSLDGGLINHKDIGYGENVIVKRNAGITSIYNNRVNIADDNHFIPAASDGTTILYLNDFGNGADNSIYRTLSGSYYASGHFITNEYAEISAIDKLYYDVTCNFTTLASGESIQVEYSIDGGSTYTSLGTASYSVDGAITNKNFIFGDNIVSKTLVLRITLAGDGTTTPTLKDYSVRFVPTITTKKLWNININCGDEVKRLDGALVAMVGRELKGRLERAWWTKSILDFQDLDYATTQLDGSLSAAATTVTVDSTADFPEQGRIRVDNEEIIYTGKTPTTFTGCTRASRETKAAAHSDNAVVNNAYKVILTDLNYRVPVALEDRELEYVVGLSL